MTQSRPLSAIETTLNVGSGFVLALVLTYFVLPTWTPPYTGFEAVQITTLYAVVSWLRSFAWRRLFVRYGG